MSRLRDAAHGSWYLCLELGVGSDGQRRRLRCGGYPSQAEARRALAGLRAPSGGAPGPAGWTTGRWLARWLAGKQGLRTSSVRSYRGHVRLYLLPHLGRIPLQSLTPADVQGMFSAALNAAVREQLLADDPAR